MKNVYDWLKDNFWYILGYVLVMGLVVSTLAFYTKTEKPQQLKEYKDGVQNHLVFNIKGTCYFVRPNDDVTVYLIPVPDCNRDK